MRVGIKVNLKITDSVALRNEGYVIAERRASEDDAIRLLFEHPSPSKAFKVIAVDIEGAGSERIVRVVADVRNKEAMIRDANDFVAAEGLCEGLITSPFQAFRDMAVSKNNYTCRSQIGVSFDEGVQMNNTDIRRTLERSFERQPGL